MLFKFVFNIFNKIITRHYLRKCIKHIYNTYMLQHSSNILRSIVLEKGAQIGY